MPRKRKAAPTEVFISHSSGDAVFIQRLKEVLNKHGVKSFVSKINIRGAQQWHDEIGTALQRCDWFLLVLSPQAVQFRLGKTRINVRSPGQPLPWAHNPGSLQRLRPGCLVLDPVLHRMG